MVMSTHAKAIVACAMYEKGRAFLGASLLVNQKKGNAYVVLHLLCQGIEIVLKALLLRRDYDTHRPTLKRLGHNLVRTATSVRTATDLHVFTHGALAELQILNSFYSQHLLRYASNVDILINPETIPHKRVARHAFALVKYCEKKGTFNVNAI